MNFRVPAFAARHRHPLVRLAIPVAHLVFGRRKDLDRPLKDAHGHILLPALPHLRLRPLKGETADELDRRRADFMQAFLSVWLVQLGSISYRSKAILARDHATADDPFMSLRELAELAELVDTDYVVKRSRTLADGRTIEVLDRDPGDRVERVTRFQRAIGMIAETKQNREKKADGGHRSTGAGLRRMVWKVACYVFGGAFAAKARKVHAWEMQQAEDDRRAQREADEQFRDALADQQRHHAERHQQLDIGEPAPEIVYRAPGQPDPVIADTVATEHPTWSILQINDEARRIERLIAETAPAGDTS